MSVHGMPADCTEESIAEIGVLDDIHLLSVAQFLKLTGISETTRYEEIWVGRLKSKKVGRRRLFRVSDVHAWVDYQPDG